MTSPNGTKRGLLVVDGDNVYIDNARIRNLTASNINVANLFAQNADITGTLHVGTGSIGAFIQGAQNRILIVDNT